MSISDKEESFVQDCFAVSQLGFLGLFVAAQISKVKIPDSDFPHWITGIGNLKLEKSMHRNFWCFIAWTDNQLWIACHILQRTNRYLNHNNSSSWPLADPISCVDTSIQSPVSINGGQCQTRKMSMLFLKLEIFADLPVLAEMRQCLPNQVWLNFNYAQLMKLKLCSGRVFFYSRNLLRINFLVKCLQIWLVLIPEQEFSKILVEFCQLMVKLFIYKALVAVSFSTLFR